MLDAEALLSLEHRQVDLWYVLLDKVASADLLAQYRAILSADERDREQRFLAEHARLQYLAGRALIRTTLSQYAGVEPGAWRFSYNAQGKPSITGALGERLEFNLSHTEGVLVLGVTSGAPVGVDVEARTRKSNARELARRFFSPAEAAALDALSPEGLLEPFFEFWTLKEAFIKARGLGLAMPLDQFAFTLAAGQAPQITFSGQSTDRPEAWQFARLVLASRYQIAVAAQLPQSEPWSIRVWETVPLVWRSEGKVLARNSDNLWSIVEEGKKKLTRRRGEGEMTND